MYGDNNSSQMSINSINIRRSMLLQNPILWLKVQIRKVGLPETYIYIYIYYIYINVYIYKHF